MRGIRFTTAALIFASNVACVSAGNGPSFDCDMAASAVEKAICSDGQLMKQDSQMADLYKQAKSGKSDKGIQTLTQAQRQWIKNRNRCGKSEPQHVVSCLQQQYQQRIAELSQANTVFIKGDYHGFDQKKWLSQLDLLDKCSMRQEGEYSKNFIKYLQLGKDRELMALGCNYWAYQGEYVIYLLNKNKKGTQAMPLRWIEPSYNETSKKWGAKEKLKLTGHTQLNAKNKELSVLRTFVGRGNCGSWTRYKLDNLSTTQSNKPHAAVADANCDTEVYQDQWPELAVDSLVLE